MRAPLCDVCGGIGEVPVRCQRHPYAAGCECGPEWVLCPDCGGTGGVDEVHGGLRHGGIVRLREWAA
jgi:hypothetical protein